MRCREGCGACCITPSINQPIPGMPHGKPAGVRCIHLSETSHCRLFLRPERPRFCTRFEAEPEICGATRREAMICLEQLEAETLPS